jgi:hypothetical protein
MEYILGIDSGLDGGLCLYGLDHEEIQFIPMPMYTVEKTKRRNIRANEKNPENKKTKKYSAKVKYIDEQALLNYLREAAPRIRKAYLEGVASRPTDGVVQAFKFGEAYGMVRMALSAIGIPYELVTPNQWTKRMHSGIPKSVATKDRSVIAATRLFPKINFVMERCRTPHLGCVDATLIAHYGYERERNGNFED